jgi:small nuclear ribonucleoprotein (snRNP)-like protein
MSAPNSSPASSHLLQSLLYSTLRIKIRDNRTFIGQFICVDKQQNIVLAQAEEFLEPEEERIRGSPISRGPLGGREMGMVTISGKDVVKIEAEEEQCFIGGMNTMSIM